jgi:hypothetical protein
MNRNFAFLLVSLLVLVSNCEEPKTDNFVLKGQVKGLKKGVLYLQRAGDSLFVNLDSMVVKGEKEFELSTHLEEPLLLYLNLAKKDGQDHFIPFFADQGETYITTTLENFSYDAKVKGSKQQAILEDYLKVMSGYNDNNLDLIAETLEAQKAGDSVTLDSLRRRSDNLLKRKYAFTINFALNNADSEIAPYLALYEIPNTSIKYVDSIYGKLTDPIKNSFYGRQLKQVLEDAKTVSD